MTRLSWNETGTRFFEAGVDRGILYADGGVGVVWNGLVSVKESTSGGQAKPFYAEGLKYLNLSEMEEFSATIDAFSHPEEFNACVGIVAHNGLYVTQQARKPFGFCYRTRLGNDLKGIDYGYKLHIVYNAMVAPSEAAYSSLNSDADPTVFSWEISTTPEILSGRLPTAHFVIDSTKSDPLTLGYLEGVLYGAEGMVPRLPSATEVMALTNWSVSGLTSPVTLLGTASSTIETITNLFPNPSFETASGVANVRTNLFNGTTMLLGAGSSQTTGISYKGSTWTRLSSTTAGHGLRAYTNLSDLANGSAYAAEWEVANDGTSSVSVSLDWCDNASGGGVSHTIAAGERKRIKVIGTLATYDATYRFADIGLSVANTNILFREILIEKDNIKGPYFNGANPITNPVKNSDVTNDTADWVSGQPLTRVFEDNKWWMNAPANTHTYASFTAVIGQHYAVSMRVKGPVGTSIMIISTDNVVGGFTANTSTLIPESGEIVVTSASGSVPPAGAGVNFGVASLSVPVKITEMYAERVNGPGILPKSTYFKDQGDFTYVWGSTPDASISHQQAPGVAYATIDTWQAKVFQSKIWSSQLNKKSLRIRPTTGSDSFAELFFENSWSFEVGKTYTVLATFHQKESQSGLLDGRARSIVAYDNSPTSILYQTQAENTTGNQKLALTFTVTTGIAFFRLYNGSTSNDVWWDDITVVEGAYTGPSFDGSTPSFTYKGQTAVPSWVGAINASKSKFTRYPSLSDVANLGDARMINSNIWAYSDSKWIDYGIVPTT